MTDTTFEVGVSPFHITKLEVPEGFQVWEDEIQQYLTAVRLWERTKVENKDTRKAEIVALANAGSDYLDQTTAITAIEEKISAWEEGMK